MTNPRVHGGRRLAGPSERRLALWSRFADRPPDRCLANLYLEGANMGPQRDADEADLEAPVSSR